MYTATSALHLRRHGRERSFTCAPSPSHGADLDLSNEPPCALRSRRKRQGCAPSQPPLPHSAHTLRMLGCSQPRRLPAAVATGSHSARVALRRPRRAAFTSLPHRAPEAATDTTATTFSVEPPRRGGG